MLQSLNVPEVQVASRTSICIAIFSGFQCTSALIWGFMADKSGRKPAIITAVVMHMVFINLLGFSKTQISIFVAMAFLGIACGNSGTLR